MSLYAGVDGGGSHARALITNAAGAELARFDGPPGIVDPRDPSSAARVIAAVVRGALRQIGAAPPVTALCCGLAGAGRPEEQEAVRAALLSLDIAQHVVVTGDAEAAMNDAFGSDPGVMLIAGTGSIARARTADGTIVRVGGWGTLLGDEGSAYAISVAALRVAAQSHDGRRPHTQLLPELLTAAGVHDPYRLVAWSAHASKAETAALCPLVLRVAEDGDDAALAIRRAAIADLTALAVTAARAAQLDAPALALAGGLIRPGGPLRAAVCSSLAAALPAARISTEPVDAARGAARAARRAALESVVHG